MPKVSWAHWAQLRGEDEAWREALKRKDERLFQQTLEIARLKHVISNKDERIQSLQKNMGVALTKLDKNVTASCLQVALQAWKQGTRMQKLKQGAETALSKYFTGAGKGALVLAFSAWCKEVLHTKQHRQLLDGQSSRMAEVSYKAAVICNKGSDRTLLSCMFQVWIKLRLDAAAVGGPAASELLTQPCPPNGAVPEKGVQEAAAELLHVRPIAVVEGSGDVSGPVSTWRRSRTANVVPPPPPVLHEATVLLMVSKEEAKLKKKLREIEVIEAMGSKANTLQKRKAESRSQVEAELIKIQAAKDKEAKRVSEEKERERRRAEGVAKEEARRAALKLEEARAPPQWWLAKVPCDGSRCLKCLLCDTWYDEAYHGEIVDDNSKASKAHRRNWGNYNESLDYWYDKVVAKRREYHPDLVL